MAGRGTVRALMNLVSDFCEVHEEKYRVVKLKERIKFTRNIRGGSLDDLKNGVLYLFEKSHSGDCLCLLNDSHLVIVDRRDILDIIC